MGVLSQLHEGLPLHCLPLYHFQEGALGILAWILGMGTPIIAYGLIMPDVLFKQTVLTNVGNMVNFAVLRDIENEHRLKMLKQKRMHRRRRIFARVRAKLVILGYLDRDWRSAVEVVNQSKHHRIHFRHDLNPEVPPTPSHQHTAHSPRASPHAVQ